jgi:prepilin-type N-terminal cleavage/methylation domain-containing protein
MTFDFESKRGFSLIEIIVVLLIVSFATALVMPSFFKSISGLEQRTSINKLATMLRYARSKAVTTKQAYQVHLDLNTYSYWLAPLETRNAETEEDANSKNNSSKEREKVTEVEVPSATSTLDGALKMEKVVLGPKKEITSGKTAIIFYPRGDSSGGEIVLKDTFNTLHTVVVDPFTGRVKLKK